MLRNIIRSRQSKSGEAVSRNCVVVVTMGPPTIIQKAERTSGTEAEAACNAVAEHDSRGLMPHVWSIFNDGINNCTNAYLHVSIKELANHRKHYRNV